MQINHRLFYSDVSGSCLVYCDLLVRFLAIDYDSKTVNTVIPPHRHEYYEFYILLRGKQFTNLHGVESVTEEGGFFLVPPGMVHGHRHYYNEDDSGILVRFELERIKTYPDCPRVAEHLIHTLSVPHTRPLYGEEICSLLTQATLSPERLRLQMLSWLIRLGEVYEADANVSNSSSMTLSPDERELVRRVIVTLDTLSRTDVNVKKVAEYHSISYRHLSRIFLRHTGYTMIQFVSLTRVRNALPLLSHTNLTISEIAMRTGFHSESYFSNLFNKLIGISPSAYRVRGDMQEIMPPVLVKFETQIATLGCYPKKLELDLPVQE